MKTDYPRIIEGVQGAIACIQGAERATKRDADPKTRERQAAAALRSAADALDPK